MPTVQVEIQIWCDCGEGLCRQAEGSEGTITVDPCGKCLENARREGWDEGDEEGYQRGYDEATEEHEDNA